jgi:ABC-type nitrate/sulfonate/bicarbonate transport system substrate-binding protein
VRFCSKALAGDSLDLIFDSPTGVISMIAANQPVIGIYGGCYQTDFSWLAKPAIKNWNDLRGGTLGISTFGTGTDALTRSKKDTAPPRGRKRAFFDRRFTNSFKSWAP